MPPRFSEESIHRIVQRLRDDYREHMAMLRVRRLLIERVTESYGAGNGTGTNVPAPFDKSKLIIQTLIGDVPKALQEYKSIIAANAPRVQVANVLVNRSEATARKDKTAGEEERVRQVLWDAAGGREKQGVVTWSQAWGRVGWYFTQRRQDAFGMPERLYYDGLSPEELAALKESGQATPEPIQKPDGGYAHAESGTAYMARRDKAAKQGAVSARSLYTLDAYGPDVVYPAFDSDGTKYAAAVLEVPAYDCGPGSVYAQAHYDRNPDAAGFDRAQYGLYYDAGNKRIVGGITSGGEENVHSAQTWTYTIFATREETYCLVGNSPDAQGTLVWYSEHDFGECAFVPAPAYRTDSTRPGGQFSSPMEKMFAEAPILNQLMTLSSLIASYNGIPRWVIVQENGQLVRDSRTGDPVVIASETTPGLDPKDASIVGGKPMQLTIDADTIFKWLEFYAERFDEGKPNAAVVGGEGVSGSTAWGMRQMVERGLATLREPVDNHAGAVAKIQRMWGNDLRCAAERGEIDVVYAFPVTSKPQSRAAMSLIAFDPADFTDAFQVTQSSDTADAKIVKQQAGIERLGSGTTTLRQVLADFMDEDDPREAEINILAYDIERYVLYGDTTKIAPNSLLADYIERWRGRISKELMEKSPGAAIQTAEQMAMQAQQAFQQQIAPPQLMAPQQANMTSAVGISQPGLSAPMTPQGQPGGGQVPPVVTPVAAGVA